jgi:hypothetical protein
MRLALLLLPLLAASTSQEPITGKLSTHALFSRLALAPVGDCGPNLRLLVEAPRRPSETHVPRVEAMFAPWLAQLDQVFIASYITPAGLERRTDVPELGVVILSNISTLTNAKRYEEHPDYRSESCLYIEDPGVVVGLWNERMARVPVDVVRRPVIERVVEGLLASYYRGAGRLPKERWVVEGLAGYYAGNGAEAEPEDLVHPTASAGPLERTLAWLASPKTESLLLPLELIASSHEDNVREQVGRSRARLAGSDLTRPQVHQLFRDQATLWVHFMERGDGGRFLVAWHQYVAKVLHDSGSPEELALTLGLSLEELDHAFRLHLEVLAGGEEPTGSGGPVVVDEGPILHEGLALPAEDTESVLADALGRASRGKLELALAFTEAGLRSLRGDGRGAVAAERDRLRTVREARDTYLAALPGSKLRLRWTTTTGERASARVTALADGVLTLDENKYKVASVRVDELSAMDLANSMGSKAPKYGPAWVRPYLLMLAGEKRWDKKLDKNDPDGAALAAAADLPRLAREGWVRATLADLARAPLPSKPAEVRATLAQIRDLTGRGGTSPALQAGREGLRGLASQVLGLEWDTQGLERRLKGKVSREGGGRVRITYEFDDPAELQDFAPVPDYLTDRAALLPAMGNLKNSGWQIKGGNLEGIGQATLRHLASLAPPISVTYELVYGRTQAGTGQHATVLVGMCDNGRGGYVGAWDLFDLDAIDPETGYVRTAYHKGERKVVPAHTYHLQLNHGGRKASLSLEGKQVIEVPTGRRDSGATLLWLHADVTVAVRRLEISGTLVKGEDDPARQSWLATKLAELGL